MTINLLAELHSMECDFPPVLRRVGEYVRANADRVVYQTITELGEETRCSLASIQRFYRQLGFESYADFKLRLATELAAKKSRNSTEPRTQLDALVDEGIEALAQTKELVAQDRIKPVTRRLLKSRRIAVFGVAASKIVAEFFHFKMLRLGKPAETMADPHMATITLASMSTKDVFVFFSSTGSSPEAVRLAKMAKERGIWTLGIVNRSKSPITDYLDEQLVVAAPESPLTGGSFSAKACQMLVVEALHHEAMRISEPARQMDQAIASAVVEIC